MSSRSSETWSTESTIPEYSSYIDDDQIIPPSNRISAASTSVYADWAYDTAHQIIDAATSYEEAYEFMKPRFENPGLHVTDLVAIYNKRFDDDDGSSDSRSSRSTTNIIAEAEKKKDVSLISEIPIGLRDWVSQTRSRLQVNINARGNDNRSKARSVGRKLKRRCKIARRWYCRGAGALAKA